MNVLHDFMAFLLKCYFIVCVCAFSGLKHNIYLTLPGVITSKY